MLLLLADDLTGSCDAGVQFAARGLETLIALGPYALERGSIPPVAMLAVNTASRLLPADEAADSIGLIARTLLRKTGRPRFLLKKIDSTLRGNIGAELATLLGVYGFGAAFIAPALPAQGRAVKNGELLINGEPLHKTGFAADPANPVSESSLLRILQGQGLENCALVEEETINDGPDALRRSIAALLGEGARYLIFDSNSQAQLELIARAGLDLAQPPLFCGSAGLAAALANQLGSATPVAAPQTVAQKLLFICGSAHQTTWRQIDALKQAGVPVLVMQPDSGRESLAARALELLGHGSVAVTAPEKRLPGHLEISVELAGLVLAILEKLPQGNAPGLCLTGGETAFAVLARMGSYLQVCSELEPGIAVALLQDGPWAKTPIITKAGGFGIPDTLLNVLKFMTGGKKDER